MLLRLGMPKVMIMSFKSVSPCYFQNPFQRDWLYVLLEDKQKGKSGKLIGHGFDPLLPIVYKCFNYYLLYSKVYFVYLQVHE